MIFWTIIISLGLAYVIQFILAMIQMKNFNLNFRDLRKIGKVAIGKKKGGFVAGSIAMFAVNDEGMILKGLYLSGVTVLSRFKELNEFNGINIVNLREDHVKKYPKQVQKSILDASLNYITIITGGVVEDPKSPLQKLTGSKQKIVTQE
ncbi:transcriptional regulator GutM [Clostridium sp.]|uniref:transcriptional regulator GutM n=1 Tax=Clostridium sp. TaxID=1506 RepID=UPI002FCA2669